MNKPDSSIPALLTSADLFTDLSIGLLQDGKSIRFRAPGRSMYPTIREGDVITVEPIAPGLVQRGDIILYRLECGVVAHRLRRIERTREGIFRYFFRSDTWDAWDEPVLVEQILGKVISVERKGRAVDPYCKTAQIRLMVHTVASSLRRFLLKRSQ